ncbi:MAG: acetyl-CoA acetyltransferase, partial [Myxococcota bacterium]
MPPSRERSTPLSEAYIIGVGSTPFGRHPDRSHASLAGEAVDAALADAGLPGGSAPIEQVWFGSAAMQSWGQPNIRGQVCLDALLSDGRLPTGTPVINVEGACATGSLTLHGAYKDIRSGEHDLVLATGVDKTFLPGDPTAMLALFLGAIDQQDPDRWRAFYTAQAEAHGQRFSPHPYRIVFIDVHAMQARHHMAAHGTTAAQLAAIAAKNHSHGADNPKAQHRTPRDVAAVLADKPVIAPFTRAMCAPISDGAAAAVVCSQRWLDGQPPSVQQRAVRIRSSVLQGGRWRDLSTPNLLQAAAKRAYDRAGLTPKDVDVAEVHDASSFCELQATELLGFCDIGSGGVYAAAGATSRGGSRPVNLSGGLVSKGHPLAATGLGMIEELATQLRGEAGTRQQPGARIGLQHNAGGMIGLDEALCAVHLLEATP